MRFLTVVRGFSEIALKDFKVGSKVFATRKITRKDLEDFARISGDFNTVHMNEGVVHGAFLNSIVSGVIGTKLPGPGCLVVQQTLNFPKKCFINEEIKVTVELEEIRKIWKVSFNCKVEDKTVLFGDAKLVFIK
ncbi:unnamed protein product [Brassicogethes aeneus]|uniref:MaoC-like domain-containing protein n=1 Tax=Brassicogethes aeneus TaxID=1431903 RepID=A0A9P0B9F6_BRAAE|nr:unnamed protein product [Brassicogethes aeneus]